ncbi:MAG: dTDP-4-dehydrorhamnose reductase [bacterium]|nr:dTDP-4-dehydrorhamnose reductase [bacterium]
MKILITGANGQLGYWLKRVFADDEILATDKEEMDITNREEVLKVGREFKPAVIIHAAAYTNVDGAESDQKTTFLINDEATENVAELAKEVGAKVVYVSTDYVFDGTATQPYKENDQTNPQSIYGKSKLAGEKRISNLPEYIIARTAWLYGENGLLDGARSKKNFVETMLKLAEEKTTLGVVNDQVGSPTYTKDLAGAIKKLIDKNVTGVFHAVNSGHCSWYDFACEIFRLVNKEIKVSPISTNEYPGPAKRPQYSVLSTAKLANLGIVMRDWQSALADYLKAR